MVELKWPDGYLPLIKERRILIPLSDESFNRVHQVAWRHQTSVAYLGKIAILQMLLADMDGKFSIVPEFQPDRNLPRA